MATESAKVVVTDIKIPLRSMVVFMVKLVVATTPALVILILFGFIMFGLISSLIGSWFMGMWSM